MWGGESQGAIARTVTEKLRDGQVVQIRPISRDDKELEREFIENLSQESRHFRFLGGLGKPTEQMLDQLTNVDHEQHEAFIALIDTDSGPKEIGVSRYVQDPDGMACECAVTVADEWQRDGLGTLLMNRLIESARSHGIGRIYSIDSAENFKIRDVARAMGFECHTDPNDATQVIYSLDLRAAA